MQTLDTKHKDSDLDMKGGRYVAKCVEHNVIVRFAEHYPAGRAIAHPDEWCKKCQLLIKAGKRLAAKDRMNPADLHAPIHNDLRMAVHNNAHDKKWRNGPVNRDKKTEANRTADEVGIYVGNDRTKVKANNVVKAKRQRATRKPSEVSTKVEAPIEAAIATE
jgi:hypothetical protein